MCVHMGMECRRWCLLSSLVVLYPIPWDRVSYSAWSLPSGIGCLASNFRNSDSAFPLALGYPCMPLYLTAVLGLWAQVLMLALQVLSKLCHPPAALLIFISVQEWFYNETLKIIIQHHFNIICHSPLSSQRHGHQPWMLPTPEFILQGRSVRLCVLSWPRRSVEGSWKQFLPWI